MLLAMWRALLCLSVAVAAAENCTDVEDWMDALGDDCDTYVHKQYCTSSGGYGPDWTKNEFGTFDDYTYRGLNAAQACCGCGGGNRTGKPIPTMKEAPAHTLNGCECKKSWSEGNDKCDSFCCNPDNDIGGPWCMVESQTCEEADWGYCLDADRDGDFVDADDDFNIWGEKYDYGYGGYGGYGSDDSAGTTPDTAKNDDDEYYYDYYGAGYLDTDHFHCTDEVGFTDADGYACSDYDLYSWCFDDGRPGWGWHEEWGSLAEAARKGGLAAPQACCVCGGGHFNASQGADFAGLSEKTTPVAEEGSSWGVKFIAAPALLVVAAGGFGYCFGRRRDTGLGDGIPTKLGRPDTGV